MRRKKAKPSSTFTAEKQQISMDAAIERVDKLPFVPKLPVVPSRKPRVVPSKKPKVLPSKKPKVLPGQQS